MNEPKTKPTDASVDDFLESAETPRRQEEGKRLAEIFREVTETDGVMWGLTMVGYGTYEYVSPSNPRNRGTWFKTGFSPRKAKLTLYGLQDHTESRELLPALGTYTLGKGCLYANKLDDLDLDVLRRLIAIAWKHDGAPAADQ